MFRVPAAIEDLFDLRGLEGFFDGRVAFEQRHEAALAFPDLHRLRLHDFIGAFAGQARVGQRQQRRLGEDESLEGVEVLLHAVGIDQQVFDDAGQAVEREVGQDGRIRRDHALDR